jgi:hypothetical protein
VGGIDFATLQVKINATGAKETESEIASLGRTGSSVGQTLVAAGKAIAAAWILREVIKSSADAQYSFAQLQAAVKSTAGVAGYSAEELRKYAEGLQETSVYGHEAVESAQAILLTFTNIGHDALPRATQAVVDLAARMGGDLRGAALQVGKALQDPAVGLTMLRRSGIMFTDSQTEVIKRLYDTGKAAEAQAMTLDLLEQKVGGAAEASRNTLGGALEYLKNTFSDTMEVSAQGTTRFVDAIVALADALKKLREVAEAVAPFLDFSWLKGSGGGNPLMDAGVMGSLKALGEMYKNGGVMPSSTPPTQPASPFANSPGLGSYVAGAVGDPFGAQAIRRDQQEADAARATATALKDAKDAAEKAAKAEKDYRDAISERVKALKDASDMGQLDAAATANGTELMQQLIAAMDREGVSREKKNFLMQQAVDLAGALYGPMVREKQKADELAASWSAVTANTKKAMLSLQDYINAGQGEGGTVGGYQMAVAREDMGVGKTGTDYTRLIVSALLPILQQGLAQIFGSSQLGSAASGALSGAASGFMTAGPWGALIGGLSGAVTSLFGFSDSAGKAAAAMRKAQNDFIVAAQEAADAFGRTGAQQGVADLTKKIAGQNAEWGKLFGGAGGFDTPGTFTDINALRTWVESMKQWSAEMTGPARAAWDANIESYEKWIAEWEKATLKFGDSLSEMTAEQNAYNKIFGKTAGPNDAMDIIAKMAPALAQQFGLGGMDLNNTTGQNAARSAFQDIYKLIESGGLTADLLGGFTDKNQLLQSIMSVIDAMDSLATVTNKLVTDIPKAINLTLYERLYGTGVGGTPAAPGLRSPTPAPIPVAPNPSQPVQIYFAAGSIVTQATSGDQLLTEIESAAQKRVAGGGRVIIAGVQ